MEKEDKILQEIEELKKITLLGTKKVLTVNDACMLTGLSKSYIYKLVSNKDIPHYKSQGGKFTYFDREVLEKWLLNRKVLTNEEIQQKASTYLATGRMLK